MSKPEEKTPADETQTDAKKPEAGTEGAEKSPADKAEDEGQAEGEPKAAA